MARFATLADPRMRLALTAGPKRRMLGAKARQVKLTKHTFTAGQAQGTNLAAIVRPFGGNETFTTVGTVPGQLQLGVGGLIQQGATLAVAGTQYSIMVRVTSADGKREISDTLVLLAQ